MIDRYLTPVLIVLLLSACSHFQGPGDYKTGADYAPTPVTDQTPSENAGRQEQSENPEYSATFHLTWPVANVRITQNFEPVKNRHHKGLDLGGHRDTPIMAAHDGRVIYTGRDFHGYGNMVLLEFDNEWATLYAHLRKIRVREGQYVHTGSTIGTMGRTGHATGVHLHFELMHKKLPIDPLLYLQSGQAITAHPTNRSSYGGSRISDIGG